MVKAEITDGDGDPDSHNGEPEEAPVDPAASGRDPVTGKFLSGHNGMGGGRPRRADWDTLVRQMAKDLGEPVETIYRHLTRKTYDMGMAGNLTAIAMFLDRGLGAVKKVALEVNVSAQTVNIAAQFRADLKDMLDDPENQQTMLDELRRRTITDGE